MDFDRDEPWEECFDGPPDDFWDSAFSVEGDMPPEEWHDAMEYDQPPDEAPPVLPSIESHPDEPPAKRRRLSGKQVRPVGWPEPAEYLPSCKASSPRSCSNWDSFPSHVEFLRLSHRDRYRKLWYKFTRWAKEHKRLCLQDGKLDAASNTDKAEQGGAVPPETLSLWLDETAAPEWVKAWCTAQWATQVATESKWLSARTVLLTWNGDWGDLGVPSAPKTLQEHADSLKSDTEVLKLWGEFLKFLEAASEAVGCTCTICSMEVCPKTLLREGSLRFHLHAYLKRDVGKMSLRSPATLMFRGSEPHKASHLAGQRIRQYGTWAAAYYLQAPKLGVIHQHGDVEPFSDYPVSASWINGLLSAGKMTVADAKLQFIRTGSGLLRRLGDLDKFKSEMAEIDLQAHIKARMQLLSGLLKPFKRLPEVDSWLATAQMPSFRKKFLVLEGPSGLGKTEYAKRITGDPQHCLELNCACSDEFDLRSFIPLHHRSILWDEASPSMVAGQRKLFQCPATMVTLGQSATGMYAYSVWLNDTVMIINSNKWSEELQKLKFSDAQWVMANQVLVTVKESLFADV